MGKVLVVVIIIVAGLGMVFGIGFYNYNMSPYPSSNPPIVSSSRPPIHMTTNHPPIATDQSITTIENTPIDITLAGSDSDQNDTLTAAIVTNPAHGTLSSINQDTGVVTYTPDANFTGVDSFTFKINDGKTDSRNTAIVNIRVNGTA